MARIRTIKPEFWTDEKIVELSAWARLFFIALWNYCDDEGRLEYSPKRLKLQVFPADKVNIGQLTEELLRLSLVKRYESGGIQVLEVINFEKHQKVDRRSASKLPPPTSAESPRVPPDSGGNSLGREGKGRDQGRDQGVKGISPKALRSQTLEDFLESLKTNEAYKHIDLKRELAKMEAWLQTPKGQRRQKTKSFILNWLNRIDVPLGSARAGPESDQELNRAVAQRVREELNAS